MSKADRDNHANQMNPNHDAYWQSRGWAQRPDAWEAQQSSKECRPRDKPAGQVKTK